MKGRLTNFISGDEHVWCVHNPELTPKADRPWCKACHQEAVMAEVVAVKDGIVTIKTIDKGAKK